MNGLDSALLGSPPPAAGGARRWRDDGREPAETTETGHLGLVHRTRRGDPVRAWYRGPIVGRPMAESPRLDLAHAADQLRIAIPDGREDISLAAAFEIGRLLALAHPSMVAAILRWRQAGYQAIRRATLLRDLLPQFPGLLGRGLEEETWFWDPRIGILFGRSLLEEVIRQPEVFLGPPAPIITAGRALPVTGDVADVLARGFGLDPASLVGAPEVVLDGLRLADVAGVVLDVGGQLTTAQVESGVLGQVLTARVDQIAHEAGGLTVDDFERAGLDPGGSGLPGMPGTPGGGP
jgi:hypothetical protein